VLACAAPALAQDATSPTTAPVPQAQQVSSQPEALQEVVVTAQKRTERLQEVPISVSAFGQKALDDRNVTKLTDLDALSAGVRFSNTTGDTTELEMTIRGQTLGNPAGYFETPVGLYVDGVYVPKAYGADFDLPDLERVEILKGPQGTLYGRNTTAGAVNLITQKPTGEWSGMAEVGVGDYDELSGRFHVNLPAWGPLSVAVTGLVEDHGPYYHVVSVYTPGTFRSESPDEDTSHANAFRVAARLKATDDVTIDYSFDYSRDHTRPDSPKLISYAQGVNNPAAIFDPNSKYYVGIPIYQWLQPASGTEDLYVNGGLGGNSSYENTHTYANALTVTWNLDEATTAKSITGYRQMVWDNTTDFDGTPIPLLPVGQAIADHDFSEEVNLSGSIPSLKYIVGGIYYDELGHSESDSQLDLSYAGLGMYTTDQRFSYGTKSYSTYGQVDWTPPVLDDKLTLTGGIRYNNEKRTGSRFAESFIFGTLDYLDSYIRDGTISTGLPFGANGTAESKYFNSVTPMATARYQFDEDANVYVRYAQGFKSGGFNGEAPTLDEFARPFKPERTDEYEIGTKLDLLDRRLRLNLSAYDDVHNDLQLSVLDYSSTAPTSLVVRNAGKARYLGFEMEGQALPSDWLQLSWTLSYIHAKYLAFDDGGVDAADNRVLPYTPRFTASVSADARLFQTEWGTLHYQFDYRHSDDMYNTSATVSATPDTGNCPVCTLVAGYNKFDMRLVLSDIPVSAGEGEFTLWVKNLTDEREQSSTSPTGAALGNLVLANYAAPRTFGATFKVLW
jgi:iron complex outermembrane receptor protein